MSLFLRPCHSPKKDTILLPLTYPEYLLKQPDRHLSFWYIKPHDRETLANRIMPYMAASLQKEHLLHTMLSERAWGKEMVFSTNETDDNEATTYLRTITAFWTEPANLTANLLKLARVYFFTILRHTYRRHFFERRGTSKGDLELKDLRDNHCSKYSLALTQDDTHRLIGRPKRFGASYYRRSLKEVQKCPEWKAFCQNISAFCQSVGLHVSSDDPENNLRQLRRNITVVILSRDLRTSSRQNAEHIALVHSMMKYMSQTNESSASIVKHNNKLVEALQHEIQDIAHHLQKLQFTDAPSTKSSTRDVQTKSKPKVQRKTHRNKLEEANDDVSKSDKPFTELVQLPRGRTHGICQNLDHGNTREGRYMTVEVLVLCRWLLEHLPTGTTNKSGLGLHWKQFWQAQWAQCKENNTQSHPLAKLVGDEKYNTVGRKLYHTLSSRIHGYGHQLDKILPSDVQETLDAVRPVHYMDDGRIDLKAERKRWTFQD